MNKEKLKNIPVKESIHAQISTCAKKRGMLIQGLAERIFKAWLDENFFNDNIASSNK